jgi:hypothetical protein
MILGSQGLVVIKNGEFAEGTFSGAMGSGEVPLSRLVDLVGQACMSLVNAAKAARERTRGVGFHCTSLPERRTLVADMGRERIDSSPAVDVG